MDIRQQNTITTNNALQSISSPTYSRSNDIGNLSVEKPTIEQLNAAIGANAITRNSESDPTFGTHIHEAVAIVKDWVKHS